MAGNLYTGTLDLLILRTLQGGPVHGYGIALWIRDRTEGVLEVEQGALYPALHRLNRRGWIRGDWGGDGDGPASPVLCPHRKGAAGASAGSRPLGRARPGGLRGPGQRRDVTHETDI